MKTINVTGYNSIEEYNFDNGFDISQKDIEKAKEKSNEVNNTLFNEEFGYIILKNDKIILLRNNRFNNFLVGINNDKNIKEGIYGLDVVKAKDENKNYEIKNKDDYGIGLFELMTDDEKCNQIEDEFNTYKDSLEKKHNIRLYARRIETKPSEHYYNMTKQEVINDIVTYNNNEVEKELKLKLEEEEKEKEKEKIEEQQEKDFEEKDIVEFIDNSQKTIFDKNKAMVTNYKPLDTPTERFKFKSLEYMKSKSLLMYKDRIINMYGRNRIKGLIEDDCSVIYEEYDKDKQEWDTKLDINIENKTFNNVKVAKAKLLFLVNRTCEYRNRNDIEKYKDKNYIEQLNKLSGIKVDVCDIKIIKADRKYEIPIEIDIIDKDYFSVNIFNEKKMINWLALKEYLTCGRDVSTRLNKSKTIRFLLSLGITTENIKSNLDRLRILHKLKGNNEED